MKVDSEDGTAAWVAATLMPPSVQGQRLPQPRELWSYQSLISEPLVTGDQRASLASFPPQLCLFRHLEAPLLAALLCCSVHQAHGWASVAAVLLCRLVNQVLTGAP